MTHWIPKGIKPLSHHTEPGNAAVGIHDSSKGKNCYVFLKPRYNLHRICHVIKYAFFETVSCNPGRHPSYYIAEDENEPELLILLAASPEFWDYRCAPPTQLM